MNFSSRPHPANVPTLTEVIELTPEGKALVPARPAVVESPLLTPDVDFASVVPEAEAPEFQAVAEPVAEPVIEPVVEPVAALVAPEPVPTPVFVPPTVDMMPLASIPHLQAAATEPEPVPNPMPEVVAEPEVSEAQLSHRILSDVQRQIDSMLEFRLRESMQPLLAQFTETLMQDLRDELSRTMRDVVTRAVAQEVAKLRNR